jgi:hypothetical protein
VPFGALCALEPCPPSTPGCPSRACTELGKSTAEGRRSLAASPADPGMKAGWEGVSTSALPTTIDPPHQDADVCRSERSAILVNDQPGLLIDFSRLIVDAAFRHTGRSPGESIGAAVVVLAERQRESLCGVQSADELTGFSSFRYHVHCRVPYI